MKEHIPTLSEAKQMLGLPKNAEELGWALHSPHRDEFVGPYMSNEYMANIGWVKLPEMATLFKTQKKAARVIDELEITHEVIIVPVFKHEGKILISTYA